MKQMVPLTTLPWPEPLLPTYRETRLGEWQIARTPELRGPTFGYFSIVMQQPPGFVIKHKNKSVWMSLTRMEIESHMPHFAAARGHTVIAGLGMGFALYNIMQKPEVQAITVLEKDLNLVNLFEKATRWRSWPGADKVEFVITDALEFKITEHIDFLYVDIWPTMFHDDALRDTQRMVDHLKPKSVGYWTQEWDYVSATRFHPSEASFRSFANRVGLPLIAQGDIDYPRLAFAAVTLQLAAQMPPGADRNALLDRYTWLVSHIKPDPISQAIIAMVFSPGEK